MIDITTPIIPYKGTGIFELNENYVTVKNKLNKIKSREKILPPDEESTLEWKVIDVLKRGYKYEVAQLFLQRTDFSKFVCGKIFKAVCRMVFIAE